MSHPPDVSIVVATYDRLGSLERTLRSCLTQTNRLELSIELVVVDNHPTVSARPIVDKLSAEFGAQIAYVHEPRRNMSIVRNTGIQAATGVFVAFIDDDEWGEPDWLDELVGTLRRTGADIAVGPRLAIFAAGHPPAYDPTGRSFVRDLELAPDATIRLLNRRGKPCFGLGTGNSIFRKATCFAEAEPFSLIFGLAGGEDAELFARLYAEGCKLAWAAQARVTEIVPVHRTEIGYRMTRTKREAQHYATIHLEHTDSPRLVFWTLAAKGVIQLVAGSILSVLTLEFLSRARIRGRMLIVNGLGKLTWRRPVGYIEEPSVL
ncbi:MAG TPA: glycosyltransferase family 2 protein [Stellaceae bacterium]|nr:glycosyltransferase family 2 protein [Stellaceae bacterium]